MSDNWIVQNLNSALDTWNEKLSEIWTLLSQDPEKFKGGAIWDVMNTVNGALKGIGYGLLVLFFAVGIVKTCGSFTEVNFHLRTRIKSLRNTVGILSKRTFRIYRIISGICLWIYNYIWPFRIFANIL